MPGRVMKHAQSWLFMLSVLASPLLAAPHIAFAKAPLPVKPAGSPDTWVTPEDYPNAALRFGMAGTTGFRLMVDATGQPTSCAITTSSGFDVLDTTTCDKVMARARFIPAQNAAGKPMGGSYASRVRWVIPTGHSEPLSERFGAVSLSVDPTGKIIACKFVFHAPVEGVAPDQSTCEHEMKSQPPAFGLELRGGFQGPVAEVEFEMADVFTPELRARVLAPMPGYEQRALSIHQLTVGSDGKLASCAFAEQRGSMLFAQDFCSQAQHSSFDSPFSAINKDGVASGWHIIRVLLKGAK